MSDATNLKKILLPMKPSYGETDVLDRLKSCLDEKKIILFGAGISGDVISKWLISKNIIVSGFVDSNPSKVGSTLNAIQIYNKEYLRNNANDVFVVVSCGDYTIITKELKGYGIDESNVLYVDPDLIREPMGKRTFLCQHVDELQETYDILADDLSRKTFINMLKYRMSYDISYIKEILSSELRYFDRNLIGEARGYVDGGAYNGDTVEMFNDMFGQKDTKVFAFEPNKINIEQMKEMIEKRMFKNVHIYQLGISDKNEILRFNMQSGLATRMDQMGDTEVECDTIDHILAQVDNIDLIKLDIEGAELRALEGAKNTIQRYKPVLAICVYHRPEDYYMIPRKILEINPSYQIYFRQYELSDTETICYAIDKEVRK